jgi:hypothetical protein
MKSYLFTSIVLLFFSLNGFAQNGQLINFLYENEDELLIHSFAYQFEQKISIQNIKDGIIEWTNRPNSAYKIKIDSVNNNEIVVKYTCNVHQIKGRTLIPFLWNFKCVIQMKENKVRLLFYDIGNAEWHGLWENAEEGKYLLKDYCFNKNREVKKNWESIYNTKQQLEYGAVQLLVEIKNKKDLRKSNDW